MSDTSEITARAVYVWQWWHPDGSGWIDYRDDWPDVEMARLHHPLRYNAVPEGLVVRLVHRIHVDTEVAQ